MTDDGDDDLTPPLGEEVPDPLYQSYDKLISTVERLPELEMQAAVVEDVLKVLEPSGQLWCIDQMLRSALWGRAGAAETMLAVVWWLIELRRADDYERLKTLFQTAYDDGRRSVLDLFRDVPPHRELVAGQRLPEVRLPMDRDVTLGERRSMAAGREARILERLLMDPDPLVIRKLLQNPQLRLADIMVIASRRPTTADLLWEVVRQPRWYRRHDAREALVRNPYSETGLALKLLPTLRLKTLRQVAQSGDLHPLLGESAKRLVKLREERTAPWRV